MKSSCTSEPDAPAELFTELVVGSRIVKICQAEIRATVPVKHGVDCLRQLSTAYLVNTTSANSETTYVVIGGNTTSVGELAIALFLAINSF